MENFRKAVRMRIEEKIRNPDYVQHVAHLKMCFVDWILVTLNLYMTGFAMCCFLTWTMVPLFIFPCISS